jgi:hypothetical protein
VNIGIFGDSWASVSYKKMPYLQEVTDGLTFQKLFQGTKFNIVNHSRFRGTNLDTIQALQKHCDYDLNIVFQTDPIRECIDTANLTPIEDIDLRLPECNNFEELCELLLKNFYLELEKTQLPILLIGGCTKLCFKHVPMSIRTLDQSWTELMTPGFKDNYFYWIDPALALFNYARKKFNWKCSLADFVEVEKQILHKNEVWQTSDNFSWCHATNVSYEKMFARILEELNDYSSKTCN